MRFVRFIFALAIGIVVFALTVAGIEAIGHAVYPKPPEFSEIDVRMREAMASRDQAALGRTQRDLAEALAAYVKVAPVGAFIFVVVAWIGGAFVGGGVAALVTAWRRRTASMLVGLADVAAIMLVSWMVPGPSWMPVVGIGGSLVAAFAAGTLVRGLARPESLPAQEGMFSGSDAR